MLSIKKSSIPKLALLNRYSINGAYTDCFSVVLTNEYSHQAFVEAFYTTKLFKLERLILKWLVSKPSSDQQVQLLAAGKITEFAAWQVEARCDNQLLLCDYQGQTRSWLMLENLSSDEALSSKKQTRLYFGSAIVPTKNGKTGQSSLGITFKLLLGLHTLYSKALLSAAKKLLEKNSS
jgi:hypothetical protein